jgi:hypothetical protein
MKKIVAVLFILLSFSGCETARQVLGSMGDVTGNTNNTEVIAGLKEALRVSTDTTTKKLSVLNGFYGDAIIRILMPPEAEKVEKTLRDVGFGKTVDKAIVSMNRAAEDATKYVGSIFWNSIKQMTINDAIGAINFGIQAGDRPLSE